MLWCGWRKPITTSTAGKCCLNGFVMAEKQPQPHTASLQVSILHKKQKAPLIPVARFLCVAPEISLLSLLFSSSS